MVAAVISGIGPVGAAAELRPAFRFGIVPTSVDEADRLRVGAELHEVVVGDHVQIRRSGASAEPRVGQAEVHHVGMARFIDHCDSPVVGSYFDVGNVITWTKQLPEHWVRVLGKRIGELHVKDRGHAEFGDPKLRSKTAVGTDGREVHWANVRKELARLNFSSWATAEIKGGGERRRLAGVAKWMDQVLGLRSSRMSRVGAPSPRHERKGERRMSGRKQQSRRRLLKGSVATAAASLVGTTASLARSAHAAGSDEIKIALIGCGGRGTGAAAQALHTAGPVKLWAMADAFEDRLEGSLKRLSSGAKVSRGTAEGLAPRIDVPPQRRFVGLDAYRPAIDSGVDLVLLTTPPGFRPAQFEYAVRQGKHVFMEKPVAVDSPGIRRVLAAGTEADRKGLKVGVGLHRRHDPVYQETIKRIHDGAIGKLALLCAYSNRSGTGKYLKRTPEMTEMQYQVGHWYYFTWLSGDFIVEQSIHMLDVCNWAKGDYPVTAQGQGGRQVRTGKDYGQIYDHFFIEYTYEDGSKLFSQNRHIPGCWNSIAHHVYGPTGHAQIGKGVIEGKDPRRTRLKGVNPYQVEHDALFDAVRKGTPYNETEYGAMSTLTAVMGRMAGYSGREIRRQDALESKASLLPERLAWDAAPPVLPDADGAYPVAVPGVTKVL